MKPVATVFAFKMEMGVRDAHAVLPAARGPSACTQVHGGGEEEGGVSGTITGQELSLVTESSPGCPGKRVWPNPAPS